MTDDLLTKLRALKLSAIADGMIRQREAPGTYNELGFAERLVLLVEEELLNRENSRVGRLRKRARLRHGATPEGLCYPVSRGLKAEQMCELLNGHYITHSKNILITGPTGSGKSWVGCALDEQEFRQKRNIQYWRMGRLLDQLEQGRLDGSLLNQLKQLQKIEPLILDDLGLEVITTLQCNDLLEITEDRCGQTNTILISQLPVEQWYGVMGNPTAADAFMDRLIHNAHRLELKGESLRKNSPVVESAEETH
ncbi:IS21-like element helper ATPase IstB [Candidatus Symbiopectobacterium sp.]|uniref:IS21-like element helper ATPase IstB n=1 Tax=Candidatus Symbiopectobacterium sp. TaxID=2816440 RepID=UPI0025BAFC75|nr:IS21-like element helper ATPase IstB [Candidatus Symbiopectobacterium sp.]